MAPGAKSYHLLGKKKGEIEAVTVGMRVGMVIVKIIGIMILAIVRRG